jgi:hypothetical protein
MPLSNRALDGKAPVDVVEPIFRSTGVSSKWSEEDAQSRFAQWAVHGRTLAEAFLDLREVSAKMSGTDPISASLSENAMNGRQQLMPKLSSTASWLEHNSISAVRA